MIVLFDWLKKRPYSGGPPNWAWFITWMIMGLAIAANLILIIAQCLR